MEDLSKEVFVETQGRILSHADGFRANQLLRPSKMASELSGQTVVTTAVVKRALERLADDGALLRETSAYRVIPADDAMCSRTGAMRIVAEAMSIELLCERKPSTELVSLGKINSRMKMLIQDDKPTQEAMVQFVIDDLEFHRLLAYAASNHASYSLVSKAFYALLVAMPVPLPGKSSANEIVSEHDEILQRIKVHDVDGAIKLLVSHISNASARLHREVNEYLVDRLKTISNRITDALSHSSSSVPKPHMETTKRADSDSAI